MFPEWNESDTKEGTEMPSESLPVATQFAQQLLADIKTEQGLARRRRPVLVSYAQRMPIGVLRQLRKAAEKHGITQTDIILQGLKSVLPVLLSQEELQQELDLPTD